MRMKLQAIRWWKLLWLLIRGWQVGVMEQRPVGKKSKRLDPNSEMEWRWAAWKVRKGKLLIKALPPRTIAEFGVKPCGTQSSET